MTPEAESEDSTAFLAVAMTAESTKDSIQFGFHAYE